MLFVFSSGDTSCSKTWRIETRIETYSTRGLPICRRFSNKLSSVARHLIELRPVKNPNWPSSKLWWTCKRERLSRVEICPRLRISSRCPRRRKKTAQFFHRCILRRSSRSIRLRWSAGPTLRIARLTRLLSGSNLWSTMFSCSMLRRSINRSLLMWYSCQMRHFWTS